MTGVISLEKSEQLCREASGLLERVLRYEDNPNHADDQRPRLRKLVKKVHARFLRRVRLWNHIMWGNR